MKKITVCLLMLLLSLSAVQAQTDYRFHSVFMYSFAKYIYWPASAQSGNFIIGILGKSPVMSALERSAGSLTIRTQPVTIVEFKEVTDITSCHMLFIPESQSKELKSALEKLKGQSTLVLTEKHGLAARGSSINFVLLEGKWRFELNETATQEAGLKVSSELAKLAIRL